MKIGNKGTYVKMARRKWFGIWRRIWWEDPVQIKRNLTGWDIGSEMICHFQSDDVLNTKKQNR